MTDKREVRIGVVGRGFGARAVAPAYEAAGCTVVDVVSPRHDPAVQALFDRADVDLISVHSPPFMHGDHVRRAIEAGHAVLCDKPFGRDAVEAKEMYELAQDAGVLNLVNYEFRAHPILSKLREFVLGGMIGDVQHVHTSSFESTWNPRRGRKYKWSFDASRGGGWIRVQGSHYIDLFRFTYGEIVDATAIYRTRVSERPDFDGVMRTCTGEDGYTAILTGESGVSSTMDAMVTSPVDVPSRSVVVGTAGVLEAIGASVHWVGGKIILHNDEGTSELLDIEPWASTAVHDDKMMRPWAVLIADAVRQQTPIFPLATFADGLAAARVMDQLIGIR